jgi:hypothetical protein
MTILREKCCAFEPGLRRTYGGPTWERHTPGRLADDWYESSFAGTAGRWEWTQSPANPNVVITRARTRRPTPPDIQEALRASKWLLELHDDWDEQGSPGYSQAVLKTVETFLSKFDAFARQIIGSAVPTPEILPGPNGSIDVRWRTSRSDLLVNFPPEGKGVPTFYGDDFGSTCIRGTLDTAKALAALTAWLMH